MTEAVVIGLGNRLRGDDAAGPEVARRVRERGVGADVLEHEGVPTDLIEAWDRARLAIVADALAPAGLPGRIDRREIGDDGLPRIPERPASTHAVDLAATIELARELGRLPERLVVYGIEAETFETAAPMSDAVASALDGVASAVLRELADAGVAVGRR